MNKLERIAILVDLTEMDEFLIRYIIRMNQNKTIQEVNLIHYVNPDILPRGIKDMIISSGSNLETILKDEITQKIAVASSDYATESGEVLHPFKIEIFTKGKLDLFVEWLDSLNLDMVVLGKKSIYDGTGSLSGKISRLSSQNVLFVPESAGYRWDNIFLGIDFSSYTKFILSCGKLFLKTFHSNILPIHILKSFSQYFPFIKNPKTMEEEEIVKVQSEYKKLKSKFKLDDFSEIKILPKRGHHVSKIIYDRAIIDSADLIVLGLKGSNDEDDLLMGSVCERLISNDKSIPILILKKK